MVTLIEEEGVRKVIFLVILRVFVANKSFVFSEN